MVVYATFMLVMIVLAICAAATAWWFGDSKSLLAIETVAIIMVSSLFSLMVCLQSLIHLIKIALI